MANPLQLNYYPFGMNITALSSTAPMGMPNRFKVQGKEKHGDFNLNWDDFGARMFDSQLGRWMSIDPASYEYYSLSPYSGMGNNPQMFIDPDGRRLYFSAGAGHDPDGTGYIESMLIAFSRFGGIKRSRDIDAHARPVLGIPRDAIWAMGEYSRKPYYDLPNVSPAGFGDFSANNQSANTVNWRIRSTVEQIHADLLETPLDNNEQFNLAGYSTGAVIMAQSALVLANEGQTIDNLVLIGATFTKDSDLYQALESNSNIQNIHLINIEGDNVIEGIGALRSFIEKGDDHPHFKYAFGDNADDNRKALALILKHIGVADYNQEEE